MRTAGVQRSATIAVRVDVDDRLLAQFLGVVLDPLGRSEQAWFLAVPRGIDEGAPRTPAALDQLAERARLLELRRHPADRILGTVDPCVVMVAAHDPLVRE